jgi:hypothetical protein
MSTYTDKTVVELRLLCKAKKLICSKLKKAELIQLLLDNESVIATDGSTGSGDGGSDSVDEADESIDDEDEVVLPALGVSKSSSDVTSLELQIKLAELEIELAKLKGGVNSSGTLVSSTVNGGKPKIDQSVKGLLPQMGGNSDCLNFFHVFERTLEMHDVSKQQWSYYLPSCLNARAMKVYSRLTLEQCKMYESVKREILVSFRLTARTYHDKFVSASKQQDESFRLFLNRLSELQTYYLESKELDTFNKLRDDCLLTQFVSSLHPNVREFVESRTPTTPEQAAQLADLYCETQGRKEVDKYRPKTFALKKPVQFNEVVGNAKDNVSTGDVNNQSKLKCWTCGGEHKQNVCPQRSSQSSNNYGKRNNSRTSGNAMQPPKGQNVGLVNDRSFGNSRFVVPAYLNGKSIVCYRDTGANLSVCRTCLVPEYAYTGECVEISGVTGVIQRVALAKMHLSSPSFHHESDSVIIVGCVDNLPYDMLLGNAFFENNKHLRDVINSQNDTLMSGVVFHAVDSCASQLSDSNCMQSVLPVVTRQQAATVVKDVDDKVVTRTERRIQDCKSDCDVIVNCSNISNLPVVAVEMNGVRADTPEQPSINVPSMSVSNECDASLSAHNTWHTLADKVSGDVSQSNEAAAFINEQRTCESLSHLWTLAKQSTSHYVVENNILYERTPAWIKSDFDKLLVVPIKYIPDLLHTAHDSIWGAHQGIKRTYDRLSSVYSAPKLKQHCKLHVKSCDSCQKHAVLKKVDRYPLQPVNITGYPFQNVVLDIYGPELPKTVRGNRFVLVIVDIATRYIHALPLRNQKSETIANELLKLFSFIGLPESITADGQSSLNSQLMTTLHQQLGIKSQFSTPYHHVGLAERYNRVISSILKSFIETEKRNWDNLLPYFCFAQNQLPNPTLGEAPSTLVWGRRLAGPLEMLRNVWTNGESNSVCLKKPVMQYLTELRNKLQSVNETAQTNAVKHQQLTKVYYDKQSTERHLAVGSLVLLLQPVSTHKLYAAWSGPHRVVERLSDTNYVIDLDGRRTTRHINLLRLVATRPKQ